MADTVATEEWACVAVFQFADGTIEQQELHRGPQERCERLARRLEHATTAETVRVPRADGSTREIEAATRGLDYRGGRHPAPIGYYLAAAPVSTLEGE